MYLGEALHKMGAGGEDVQYNRLQSQQVKLAKYMNEVLDEDWLQGRGMIVEKVAVMSVTPDDESRKRIQDMDDGLMFGNNPQMAAGYQIKGSVDAMKTAAGNQAGAGVGMMGVGLVGGFNGSAMNPGNQGMAFLQQQQMMQQQQQMQQQAAAPAAAGWTCSCGQGGNQGKFCANCGSPKPADPGSWTCSCGQAGNTGKFCANCGSPKPADAAGWTCSKCGKTYDMNNGGIITNGAEGDTGLAKYVAVTDGQHISVFTR
jgi:membrane protease subunit (stomatin/prohibitin family)